MFCCTKNHLIWYYVITLFVELDCRNVLVFGIIPDISKCFATFQYETTVSKNRLGHDLCLVRHRLVETRSASYRFCDQISITKFVSIERQSCCITVLSWSSSKKNCPIIISAQITYVFGFISLRFRLTSKAPHLL